jgi:hypothetical protein
MKMNKAIKKYLKKLSLEQRVSEYASIMRFKKLFGIEYVVELIENDKATEIDDLTDDRIYGKYCKAVTAEIERRIRAFKNVGGGLV